jgi:hypothetical protein
MGFFNRAIIVGFFNAENKLLILTTGGRINTCFHCWGRKTMYRAPFLDLLKWRQESVHRMNCVRNEIAEFCDVNWLVEDSIDRILDLDS